MERLRDHLLETGYTIDGVRDRLGDVAASALAREELVPALRATAGGDPLAALIRLWWLGVEVDAGDLPAAVLESGLVRLTGTRARAEVHLQPWEQDGYVVSDRKVRPGDPALRPDHVVGAGGASANLAQLVTRRPVERALDLGTGCGVQVLSLAERAQRVTATDVNPRAIELARLSWRLSGVTRVEARTGSLYEPVADELFDLIVANPPFVISPGGELTYRESGAEGDDFCRELVRRTPRHLNPDGQAHFLASWLHVEGEDWRERVGGWLRDGGCDAWVVERDVQDPAEYVELWLRDAAEHGTAGYTEHYDRWLAWFEEHKVEGVGFGWITMRNSGTLDPVVRVEQLTHKVALPVGDYVDDVLDAITTAHRVPDLDSALLRTAEGLLDERVGLPGAEDPMRIVLRQTTGLRRSREVGTVEAALAGVCDGELALGPLLNVIAELVGDGAMPHPDAIRPLIAERYFLL
ncbi:class I SAM-dependent methyltransferase [Nonomuraea glycinis]|uniref:Transferase n=1 Tax=Nonomuraea glycinis TaxID=2047744 RepID=A0A918A155_9ACTN|nr:class I SAM-dependent methyltransferase [Nonomuraea glycinis]MCA2176975.1 class I SAM-dependent methyltransferase [Nonomuraea glycinis]GGP02933.1 transferase [Nonomuraea glycinis]